MENMGKCFEIFMFTLADVRLIKVCLFQAQSNKLYRWGRVESLTEQIEITSPCLKMYREGMVKLLAHERLLI